MPFPLNAKGTPPQAQLQLLVFGTHAVGIRTKDAHNTRSSNIVQGSQGMTRKKRSPPHLLRCQVWQSTGASTDVAVNTNTRIHMHKETRGTALKHRRKKKNDDGYRGGFPATYVSQTQRAGHTHMRGNMRLNIAPNRFYGQTEKTHECTKTNVNLQSNVSRKAQQSVSTKTFQRKKKRKTTEMQRQVCIDIVNSHVIIKKRTDIT